MLAERFKTWARRDFRKASDIWQSTAGRNLLSRLAYLLFRFARSLVLRTLYPAYWICKYLGTRFSNLSHAIAIAWRSASPGNLLFRLGYVLRRGIRSVAYRSYRRLRSSFLFSLSYRSTIALLTPLNYLLARLRRDFTYENSVLHISYMVHIPYDTTRLLRKYGMKADYMALERGGPVWDEADYVFESNPIPVLQAWHEFRFFWKVVARYEIIHSHFAMMLSNAGWEYPLLKRMGRKIVVHYRGCEVRNREKNMALHPELNICQRCDYNATICRDPVRLNRVRLAQKYGDLFLVTTPDMRDFVPNATHFPFFLPQINHREEFMASADERLERNEIKIVHVTGHPGIEGTEEITKAVDNLKAKGHPINFTFLHIVHHDQVLREMASADLTIGKMKMGYYANAQVESMYLGIPAITWVRPEFMTSELENSGFIFTELRNLEQTLEYYLRHPDALNQKRKIAQSSIIGLHGDDLLVKRLLKLYTDLRKG